MGSVRKEGSNWYYTLLVEDPFTGEKKAKKKRGFRTKKEALRALKSYEKSLGHGYSFKGETYLTTASYFEQWLELRKGQIGIQTYRNYEANIRLHIAKYIGKISLQHLRAVDLQQLYIKLQKKLSPATVAKVHKIIKSGLQDAYRQEIVEKNVADFVKPPKIPYKELHVWTEEEVKYFLKNAKSSSYYMVYYVALITGMRKGEILGLRWKDIDFKTGTISIKQTLSSKGDMFLQPKTRMGIRSIPVPVQSLEELKQFKKRSHDAAYELIFCSDNGKPIDPANVRRSFRSLIKKLDLPSIRFHDLRHTHATMMLKHGVHPKIVSERLGHSNVVLTLNTYTHLLPNLQGEAVKILGDSLFKTHD